VKRGPHRIHLDPDSPDENYAGLFSRAVRAYKCRDFAEVAISRTAPKRSSHCWRIGRQSNWLEWVNQAETEKELESLRKSVQRGRPFGGPLWQKQIAKRLGLESAYRPIGRPRKVAQRDVADSP
jgi:hypothetical protein